MKKLSSQLKLSIKYPFYKIWARFMFVLIIFILGDFLGVYLALMTPTPMTFKITIGLIFSFNIVLIINQFKLTFEFYKKIRTFEKYLNELLIKKLKE